MKKRSATARRKSAAEQIRADEARYLINTIAARPSFSRRGAAAGSTIPKATSIWIFWAASRERARPRASAIWCE